MNMFPDDECIYEFDLTSIGGYYRGEVTGECDLSQLFVGEGVLIKVFTFMLLIVVTRMVGVGSYIIFTRKVACGEDSTAY